MFEIRERPEMVERALLIGVYLDKREEDEAHDLLLELEALVDTLKIGIVESRLVYVRDSNKGLLTGKGKAEELMNLAEDLECDCIIFDNALTPIQQRNWEEKSGICVIDREEVILDIFDRRASTKEARLQVELARMQYSLPRLTRMWAHLDRQGGGSGGGKGGAGAARGEGEKQIEVDRRLARKKIDRVKESLEKVKLKRSTQRKERDRDGVAHGAIVGYTNAGKSTLLNTLSGSDVLAEDKLFATLDTTTRRIELPDGQPVLLTDTVGFVRNLPHSLVEAFKATLEEAVLADFLVHVIDGSSANAQVYYETTMSVLEELGAGDKQQILVFNKADCEEAEQHRAQLEMKFPQALFLSATQGQGTEPLLQAIANQLHDRIRRVDGHIPHSRMDLVALLHREAKVLSEEHTAEGVHLDVLLPKKLWDKYAEFFDEDKP